MFRVPVHETNADDGPGEAPPAGGCFVGVAVTSPTYQRRLCRTRTGSGSSRVVWLSRLPLLAIVGGVRRPATTKALMAHGCRVAPSRRNSRPPTRHRASRARPESRIEDVRCGTSHGILGQPMILGARPGDDDKRVDGTGNAVGARHVVDEVLGVRLAVVV